MMDRVRQGASVLIAATSILAGQLFAGPLDETRYCTVTPHRDKDGSISRRADVLRAFRQLYPCPSTWKTSGACNGWNIDHIIHLACGGCDAVSNLTWLPVQIKRCPGLYCKDRWEREVYCKTVT